MANIALAAIDVPGTPWQRMRCAFPKGEALKREAGVEHMVWGPFN